LSGKERDRLLGLCRNVAALRDVGRDIAAALSLQ